jgi:dihydropteroate synthase
VSSAARSGKGPGATPARRWHCGRFTLALDRPLLMGVVNITPDSFSDGGHYLAPEQALAHARALVEAGADLVDLGAESTRPGAAPVSTQEELRRLEPVLEALQALAVPVSVDTSAPEVMARALALGASVVNDVRGFTRPGALPVVANSDCGLVTMHMRGEPATMQQDPHYADVVAEVRAALAAGAQALGRAGVRAGRLALDPGFGFGKTDTHNLALLAGLPALAQDCRGSGTCLLVGLSRKSTLGRITGRGPQERMAASVAAALIAAQRGADILRVHDVAQTRDALAVLAALERAQAPGDTQ